MSGKSLLFFFLFFKKIDLQQWELFRAEAKPQEYSKLFSLEKVN